ESLIEIALNGLTFNKKDILRNARYGKRIAP
ncbi:unnamed protein product, partial [marine sediment metagenome]